MKRINTNKWRADRPSGQLFDVLRFMAILETSVDLELLRSGLQVARMALEPIQRSLEPFGQWTWNEPTSSGYKVENPEKWIQDVQIAAKEMRQV
jgi:hypothetical protein